MPNTGRLYAPAATAAFRERYMRPYTVSPSVSGAHLVSSASRGGTAQQFPRGGIRRLEEEPYGGLSSGHDARSRSYPAPSFDRSNGNDRGYAAGYPDKLQRSWGHHEQSPHHESHLPLASFKVGSDSGRGRAQLDAPTSNFADDRHDAMVGRPSTLPRLSALLSRPVSIADIDETAHNGRKRPRDFSPSRNGSPYSSKHSRLYEPSLQRLDRHRNIGGDEAADSYTDPLTSFAALSANLQPLPSLQSHPSRSTNIAANESLHSLRGIREEYVRPLRPMGQNEGSRRVVNTEAHNTQFESEQSRDHSSHSFQQLRTNRQPSELPAVQGGRHRGRSLSYDRTSDYGDEACVIEAAADLVEERSPSKRESITKLLLKSKEFLTDKSLVRNRNNEIDWVATFLNVGFESSSIYSLMCPLRKGRWKVEEEKYTMELLRLIENGTIRLRHGQSIRGFIAKKLHSDDMRVLKKLSNCKMFHFARLINPRMSEDQEVDETIANAQSNLERLDKLKAEFLRSVQLEALVAVRKYLSDTSIRDLLNSRG